MEDPTDVQSLRAILFGDENSEKSQIFACLKKQNFMAKKYSSSDEAIQYSIQFDERQKVILDLIDNKQLRTSSSYPFRRIQLVLLVFSYKDISSLNNLRHWINEIQRFSNINIPMIIIGNCYQHQDATVQEADVTNFSEVLGYPVVNVKDNDIESINKALHFAIEHLFSFNLTETIHQAPEIQVNQKEDEQSNRQKCCAMF